MQDAPYTGLRHARVEDDPDVVWVVVAHWSYEDGAVRMGVGVLG